MFKCKSCEAEFRDGAFCSVCQGHFDFGCAGVTETGYRRLGERKATWKCTSCKNLPRSASPLTPMARSPTPAVMDTVLAELRRLSLQMAVLPGLNESIQSIKAELSELKTIKPELSDIKSSLEFLDHKMGALSDKVKQMENDMQSLHNTQNDVDQLQKRVLLLEEYIRDGEQRSRMNNIEIKGVPVSNSENLFSIISKIGAHIKCVVPQDQINYIARIPMRNDKQNKSIVVALHGRYLKDNFVAAAKKCTTTAVDIGLQGSQRIYVNDHLTLDNKILLNKTKTLAKDRGFAYTWVKGCRIYVRKNPTSPAILIRKESDFKKM